MPNKQYIINVPGQEGTAYWDEDRFNSSKENLYAKYPEAQVTEASAFDASEEQMPGDMYSIAVPGEEGVVNWDAQKFNEKRDSLFQKYPNAQIMRIRPVGQWGDNIRKQYSQQNAIGNLKGVEEFNASDDQRAALDAKRSRIVEIQAQLDEYNKKSRAETDAIPGALDRNMAIAKQMPRRKELERQLREAERSYYTDPVYLGQNRLGKERAQNANKELEELVAPIREERERRRSRSPIGVAGGYAMADLPSYEENLATAARNLNDETIRLYDAPSKYEPVGGPGYKSDSKFNQFAKGAGERMSDVDFWSMGLTGMVDQFALKDVFTKIREELGGLREITEENIDEVLSPMEKQLLGAFFRNADAQAARADDLSNAYQAGRSAADSALFMAEFALSGGITKAAGKLLLENAPKSVKSMARWITKTLGKETPSGLVKGATRVGTDLGKGVVNMWFQPGTYKGILEAQNQVDPETGEIVDQSKAAWNAILDRGIEVFSESTGEYIPGILGAGAKAVGADKLVGKLANTELGKWGRAFYNSDALKTLKAGGWNGYFGEMSEEFIGAALRSVTGVNPDAWKEQWDKDNIAVMALSFLPMSILGGTVNTIKYGAARKGYADAREDLMPRLQELGFSEEQITHAMDLTRLSSPEAIRETIKPIVDEMANRGATKQDKDALMDYAFAAARLNAYDGFENAKVQQQRDATMSELQNAYGDFWQGDGKTGRTVGRVTLPDGKSGYVLNTDETGLMSVRFDDGTDGFTSEEHGAQVVTQSIDSYLDSVILAQEAAADMEEQESQAADARQRFTRHLAGNAEVPMGTTESPEQGRLVVQTDPQTGQSAYARDANGNYLVETSDGTTTPLSENELASKWGINLQPESRTEAEANDVAEYESAQKRKDAYNTIPRGSEIEATLEGMDEPVKYIFTHAAYSEDDKSIHIFVEDPSTEEEIDLPESAFPDLEQAAAHFSQATENAEEAVEEEALSAEGAAEVTPRDFRGNPLPLKSDGSVDQKALWNNDPMAWVAWNDQQRQDGGANSIEYVTGVRNDLEKDIKKLLRDYKSERDFDKRDAINRQIAEKQERLNTIVGIFRGYKIGSEASAPQSPGESRDRNTSTEEGEVNWDKMLEENPAEFARQFDELNGGDSASTREVLSARVKELQDKKKKLKTTAVNDRIKLDRQIKAVQAVLAQEEAAANRVALDAITTDDDEIVAGRTFEEAKKYVQDSIKQLDELQKKMPEAAAEIVSKRASLAELADIMNSVEQSLPAITAPQTEEIDLEPRTPLELAAWMFATGKIKISHDAFARELGLRGKGGKGMSREAKNFLSILRKDGMSIETAGERLEEAARERQGEVTPLPDETNAGRNTILELFSRVNTYGDIKKFIENEHRAQAEEDRKAELRRLEDYTQEKYGTDVETFNENIDAIRKNMLLEILGLPTENITFESKQKQEDVRPTNEGEVRQEDETGARTDGSDAGSEGPEEESVDSGAGEETRTGDSAGVREVPGESEGSGERGVRGDDTVLPGTGNQGGSAAESGAVEELPEDVVEIYNNRESTKAVDKGKPGRKELIEALYQANPELVQMRNEQDQQNAIADVLALARMYPDLAISKEILGRIKESPEKEKYTAHSIEQAREDVDTNPTDAQKEAGNYKKGHVAIDGYDISIENPKGSVRSGTDADGNPWSVTMNNDYGYIRMTEGVDGDHIDVFLSDNPTEGNVFVVDQVNPQTGEFDEHKVMYGFPDAESARTAYLANYSPGWKGLGTITEVSKDEFKKWIDSSHRKTKPFSEYKSVKPEGAQNEAIARPSAVPYHPDNLRKAYESGDAAKIAEAEKAMADYINSSTSITLLKGSERQAKNRRLTAAKGSPEYKTQDFVAKTAAKRMKELDKILPKVNGLTASKAYDAARKTYGDRWNASVDELRQAIAYYEMELTTAQQELEATGIGNDESTEDMYVLGLRGRVAMATAFLNGLNGELRAKAGELTEAQAKSLAFVSGKTTEQIREEQEQRRQQPLRDRIREWEERTGQEIEVIGSFDEIKDQFVRSQVYGDRTVKAWFNTATNKVVVYLPNNTDVSDIDKTYLHEIISHKGLRELLGQDGFNVLMDRVYSDVMTDADRQRYAEYNRHMRDGSMSDAQLRRADADEYVAHLAENMDADPSAWQKFVALFKEALMKLGLNIQLTDQDLSALLHASLARYESMQREAREQERARMEAQQQSNEDAAAFVTGERTKAADTAAAEKNPQVPISETQEKYEDFGEKIGWAKKDLAKRGYTQKKGEGDARPAWRKKYEAANITELSESDKAMARRMGLRTDFTLVPKDILEKGPDYSKPFVGYYVQKSKSKYGRDRTRFITDEAGKPIIFTSDDQYEATIPVFEAKDQGYRVRQDGNKFKIVRPASNGKMVEYAEFDSREDAVAYLASPEGCTDLLNRKRENYELPALEELTRNNMPDYRNGKNITPDDFQKMFKFRGGEFGNWENAAERQQALNYAYDALMDLAMVLGVTPESLSLNGELSIAFGARGEGGARAHYEPTKAVINLTKMKGAGSLAHEWAHALDNYFGLMDAKQTRNREEDVKENQLFLSEGSSWKKGARQEVRDAFAAVMKAIKEKTVTRQIALDKAQKEYDDMIGYARRQLKNQYREQFARGLTRYQYNRKTKERDVVKIVPTEEQLAEYDRLAALLETDPTFKMDWDMKKAAYRGFGDVATQLYDLVKDVMPNRGGEKFGPLHNAFYYLDKALPLRERLEKAKAGETETVSIPTTILEDSRWFDRMRAGEYYAKDIEMFARAFENYVSGEMRGEGQSSDYLTYEKGPLYQKIWDHNPYPAGEERAAVKMAFDHLFDVLQEKVDEQTGRTILFRKDGFAAREGNVYFRKGRSLVGMHNISENKLAKAMKTGGLANPSAAVVDIARQNHEDYGEISLIMPSSLVDSETGRNIGTFLGDAWTPTYPGTQKIMSDAGCDKLFADLRTLPDEVRSIIRLDYDLYLEDDRMADSLKWWFLHDTGQKPEIVKHESGLPEETRNFILSLGERGDEAIENDREAFDRVADLFRQMSSEEEIKKAETKLEPREGASEFAKKRIERRNAGIDEYGIAPAHIAQFFNQLHGQLRREGSVNEYETFDRAARFVESENLQDEFQEWLDARDERYDAETKLFAGWTKDGEKKWLANTVENASRLMNGEPQQNAYGNGGLSATRANLVQRMRTLADIRRHKDLLVTPEEYDERYKELQDELFAAIQNLADRQKISDNQFSNIDYAEARLQEALPMRSPAAYLNAEYGYSIPVNGEYAESLKQLKKDLRAMPAKYFETKFGRPVMLDEFAAAVVPSDIKEETRKTLTDAGLPLFEYDPKESGSRREATMKATEGDNILFRKAYHGSGASFDRFDHSHMGEGEGAQAHGWGTYVSFNEDTAKGYATRSGRSAGYGERMAIRESIRSISNQMEERSKANNRSAERHMQWVKDHPEASEQEKEDHRKLAESLWENDEPIFQALDREIRQRELLVNSMENAVTYKHADMHTPLEEMETIADAVFMINHLGKADRETFLDYYRYDMEHSPEGSNLRKVYDFVSSTTDEDWTSNQNFYTVEIPEDTGLNYMDEQADAKLTDVAEVWEALSQVAEDDVAVYLNLPEFHEFNHEHTGKSNEYLYQDLARILGSQKEASKLLERIGYAGIKYDGRMDGPCAVIFNDQDVKITDHIRFRKAPNGAESNLTDEQYDAVRTPQFKQWFGDWEKAARVQKLRTSENAEILGNEIANPSEIDKNAALAYGKKLQGEYTNKDTGNKIQLQRGRRNGGVNEILQHNYKDTEHLQSVAAIPQIIEKSIYIDSEPNRDVDKNPDVTEYQHYVCGLKIGNEDYTVHSLVAVDKNGDRYYDHNLTSIEKTKLLDLIEGQAVSGEDFGATPGTEPTILNDYKGKQLVSLLQVSASKVVDENGEPRMMYHGTNKEFNTFRASKRGIWFAGTEKRAAGYAAAKEGERVIPVFLNIRKPASSEYPNAEQDDWARFDKLGYDGWISYNDDGSIFTAVVASPNQIKSATENNGDYSTENPDIRFRKVTDPAKIEELENGEKVTVYRSMQEIDGKLYPPMSARVDGKLREPSELGIWEESVEQPELADEDGNFKLDKGNSKSLKAAYAPYFHSRRSPLNEQFSEAYNRPNLVIVEGEIPASELTSGYTAEKSKKSVGEHDWPSGKVSNALAKKGQDTRKVILSRWFKPVRVVPNSEVADMIMQRIGDSDIAFPYNVVTPGLREELMNRGASFSGWQGNRPDNVDEIIAGMGGDIRFRRAFHGSHADFSEFEEGHYREGVGSFHRPGYYFASDEKSVKTYAYDRGNGAFLYEVELPDDDGSNYIHVFTSIPKSKRRELAEKIRQKFPDKDIDVEKKIVNKNILGEDLLGMFTNDELQQLGFVGIEGPMYIATMPQKQYVIFNPKDIKIKGKTNVTTGESIRFRRSHAELAEEVAPDGGRESGDNLTLFRKNTDSLSENELVKRVQDYGLRGLLDEDAAKAFWADAYAVMPEETRREIIEKTFGKNEKQKDLGIRRQVRAYIADLAKKGYAEDESGLLRYLADRLQAELVQPLDENTLRYLIWRSSKRYASNNILDLAEDIALRRRMGVGEFSGQKFPSGTGESLNEAERRIDSAENEREEARQAIRQTARKTPFGALNSAMSVQRKYDQETVNAVVSLAKDMIKKGNIDNVTAREMARLMTIIKDANGRRPATVKEATLKLIDFMVDHTVGKEKELLDKIVKVRTAKVREPGIDTIAKLDLRAQNVINSFRENYQSSEADIRQAISDLEDKLDDRRYSESSREDMRSQLEGLNLSLQYATDIASLDTDIKKVRQQMKDAQTEFDALSAEEKKKRRTALNQEIAAGEEVIRSKKIEQVDAYRRLRGDIAGAIDEGTERAKTFLEAERERVEQIHHWANSDLEGVPADVRDRTLTGWGKFANSSFVKIFTAPLANLDQMLRTIGRKSPDGRGYLWNWMMGAVRQASDTEKLGMDAASDKLNAKVKEIFDEPDMGWDDLYKMERNMPKGKIRYYSADGEWVEDELTPGNMLYIYMVNKMADGRMKLRQMNISEEKVQEIKKALDPRFVELADWVQEEFLPSMRDKYNETHKRLFGTSMATIDNYFPLRILGGVIQEKREIGEQGAKPLPSDITGAIIKRTVNAKQLNIAGTDAFSLVVEHIREMEHWNAYAEASRDFSTLLKYKRFQNQLKQLNTIYGAGQDLLNLFWDTSSLAVGAYRPVTTPSDKAFLNLAKGVTAAKIAFRAYTALKQFLSWPAFLADANPLILAKNTSPHSWKKNWEWAMENLPSFKKRVESRKAGIDILEDSDLDAKFWGTDLAKWINQNGMFMNAFVDALTVSIGARSMYETKKAKYIREGFSEEKAEEKAKFDAVTLFNETQQSSEKEFMSTMQANRTVQNVALSVYRNSSMGYQRQYHQALRTLGRMVRKGYKSESIEYMTKQLIREGLSEEDAKKAAEARYEKAWIDALIRVAVFRWLVQFAWNLGSHAIYLLFGDDPDEKKKMLIEDATHALVGGGVEGLAGGNLMSEAFNMIKNGENLRSWDPTTLPIMSDLKSTISKVFSDPVAGANDLVYLAAQIGLGANPQTISDSIVAIVDACNGDFETAREVMFCIMRIMQVPQSQIDQLMIDEIGMTAKDARELSYEDVAKRYVDYKMRRNAPVTGPLYSDDLREKREKSLNTTFKKKVNERKKLKEEE